MGEVFLAMDTRLDRKVAIKILPAEFASDRQRLCRFEQEAKTLASLDHPNILSIFEVGTHDGAPYLVSQFLEGTTLREELRQSALPQRKAVDYALQIATGLAAAHAKGIIHRDLKPENIFITGDDRVKILDFGLAKLKDKTLDDSASAEAAADRPTLVQTTEPGIVLGTVGYMSPEQVRGDEVDHRSDFFAFGCVLFEILTGQRAFKGPSSADVMSAILKEAPPSIRELNPQLAAGLDRVLWRCLEKKVTHRSQSADDLAFALESSSDSQPAAISASSGVTEKSVAVLPFVNMSADRENEFLSDGITEDLITALSKVPGLRVPARTSSFAFKGKHEDIRRIGQLLSVTHVVEGSVRKSGEKLRITGQLVKVADGYHLWSEKFDRDLRDVFAIQDEITRAIVDALKIHFEDRAGAPLVKVQTVSTEAYQLYLKGREAFYQRGLGLWRALHYFELALLEDPNYALAYSGLADCYMMLGFYWYLPPLESGSKARSAAARAMEIDANLAESQVSSAMVIGFFDRRYEEGLPKFEHAIGINPNYALAHAWHGALLSAVGKHEQATAAAERGIATDPLLPYLHSIAGWMRHLARDYPGAQPHFRKALELSPNYGLAHWFLGQNLIALSKLEEGIAALEHAYRLTENAMSVRAYLAHAYAVAGRREQALALLLEGAEPNRRSYFSPFALAVVQAGLGQRDQSFFWLAKAVEEGDRWLPLIRSNYVFDSLHEDPRYKQLLTKIGLTEAT